MIFTIENDRGEELELDLYKSHQSNLVITSVNGLGPPSASIKYMELGSVDGVKVTHRVISSRNIVFTIAIVDNVELERMRLYNYFRVKSNIKITVKNTYRNAYIYGYVESNEVDIFSERVTCNISIMCPDPYFYDVNAKHLLCTTVTPSFEIPFENTHPTEKTIVMGEHTSTNIIDFTYDGDESSGVIFKLYMLNDVNGLKVFNLNKNQVLNVNIPLNSGDVLVIDSNKGSKSATLYRNSIETNVLYSVSGTWVEVNSGENTIGFEYTHEIQNDYIYGDVDMEILFKVKYEGV